MKLQDVNLLKGKVKTALYDWGSKKVDELFPNKAHTRHFLKNGFRNLLAKEDARLNGWIDNLYLFVADERGEIDSDVMIDSFAGIFDEMKRKRYDLGLVEAVVGGGEVVIELPSNVLMDLFCGDAGKITFTKEDLLELKDFF